ncbi:MAG: hypothetical protein IKP00_03815 [Victivallales bacterium]|nr:hypothetical protein [Victivallales bacterium]
MIIGACGFGSTGSSVVTDYLREYDNITVKDDLEFTWVSKIDGLIDLERAVMNPHTRSGDSIVAIRRFEAMAKGIERIYEIHGLSKETFRQLIERFIEKITMVKWYWYDNSITPAYSLKYLAYYIMKRKIIPRLEKKAGHHVKCWPLIEVKMSVLPDNFYTEASRLVDDMLKAMGLDPNGIIALDQPFSGNNPQACFPFYRDPYAIVVDRDPRDNYVFARTRMLGRFHYMPINNVEDFIAYYRALRKDQPYLKDDPRILRIRFEDMVYEYERTSKALRDFLHLPENPRPKSVFDPELSIANTQVFKRFTQFSDDIKIIEKELPEYLFDYSKYPEPDSSKKMFYGKSPKNKLFKKSFSE